MQFTITLQPDSSQQLSGQSLEELRSSLTEIEPQPNVQIIIATDWEGLSVYSNPNRAWILWGNPDGDWACPVNPQFGEMPFEEEDCCLENRQVDEMSIRWSFPRAEAFKILLHFFEHGEKAPWLAWTDENYWE